ncbi:MAG: hypothetical protein LBV79_00450 [Candidatus Adiutrix sp.]|jgi:hypothetical protein|nr:hypothetical protein [Candidatus Adiutrix sp.]
MSLQKRSADNADRIELDIESLNLDVVSEKYQGYLAELRAWFAAGDDDSPRAFQAEPPSGHVIGLLPITK